ncbi:unnamed protein product [Bursaphelenchus xylophilus]|uniref:(pine wood nematode) hypothetical protein n=1 Tax=Bursaphelenchus xylophilus TaxID=6326 RepID=A0A1I7RVS3_BURXY|nr:unnamed protein product [Bursaphelenchus xylophilus]CAG9082098.1 unnamed protein product [Bursaphelenchus xylophilus]
MFIWIFLLATPIVGRMHFAGRIRCANSGSLKGHKKIGVEIITGMDNVCAKFILNETGEFDLHCDEGWWPKWTFTPEYEIFHSCDGHCRVFKIESDNNYLYLPLSNQGDRRETYLCPNQVY